MYALLTSVGRLLVTMDAKVYFVVGSSHLGAGAAAEAVVGHISGVASARARAAQRGRYRARGVEAVVEILLIEVMRIPPPCLSLGASARGVLSSWGWIEKTSGRET